jgi:hypothetical protein
MVEPRFLTTLAVHLPPIPSMVVGAATTGLEANTEASPAMCTLLIPDYATKNTQPYPGDI